MLGMRESGFSVGKIKLVRALTLWMAFAVTLTACSGHEPFEDHQRFLRESCLVSGGRWSNVSDECIEPTTKE